MLNPDLQRLVVLCRGMFFSGEDIPDNKAFFRSLVRPQLVGSALLLGRPQKPVILRFS
ncbi:MAG: hypothetical protein JWQ24_717 [Tardiphaga sp.]|nr:hypothetical protein [Tardiphaga sp.]